MKSEFQIYMDFKRATGVADDLRSIAHDTRNAADADLQGALSRINGCWEGENSEAFLRKGDRLKRQVEQLAREIDRIANTIDQIATNTYNAEMRAVQIAQTNSGGGS